MTAHSPFNLLPSSERRPPSIARWIQEWTEAQAAIAKQLILADTRGGLIPYDCKFKITHRCNSNCQMCLHAVKLATDDRLASQELSDFEIRRLLPELSETGCRSIHFSGGEPLLREGLERFVKDASRNGIRAKLTTNGTLVTEKRAYNLASAKLRAVNISLDGPSAAIHDKIRGVKGFFDRATRGVQAFTAAREVYGRPHVRINTVISHENCRYLDDLLGLAAELRVDSLHLLPVDFSHIDPSLALTAGDYEYLKEVLLSRGEETRLLGDAELLVDSLFNPQTEEQITAGQYALGYYNKHPCFAPFVHLFMMPKGEVYTCCIVDRSEENCHGNVRYQSVKEIWKNTAYKELRRKALTSPLYAACHSCDHFLEINRELAGKTGIKGFDTGL